MEKNKKFWNVIIIVNALFWASVIILNSLLFADYEYFYVIFGALIIISTLQMSVLSTARDRILNKKKCSYW